MEWAKRKLVSCDATITGPTKRRGRKRSDWKGNQRRRRLKGFNSAAPQLIVVLQIPPEACLVPQDSDPRCRQKSTSWDQTLWFVSRFRITFLPAYSTPSRSLDIKSYTFGRICISTHRWWVEQKRRNGLPETPFVRCNVCVKVRWLEWLLTICPLKWF